MVLRTALRVVVIAVATFVIGTIGALVGISKLDVTLGVVLRSVLVIALVLALTWAFRRSDMTADDHASRTHQQVLIAAGLAYVVDISSWGGHALFGQLLVPAGAFSALIDFLVWMAVAIGGVLLADHARVQSTAAPIPYR